MADMDRRAFLKGAAATSAIAAMMTAARTDAEEAAKPAPPKAEEAPRPPDFSWAGRFTLAAVGDLLLSRRVSNRTDPEFLAIRELLHGVDCTWGNCELVLADARRVYPMPKGGDPHSIAPPWAADEMAWTGVDFVGVANSHTLDFGYDGLDQTLENLGRVGLPYAGAGPDLAQAARPGYFDSPAGRVGQINCCSTFLGYFAASPAQDVSKFASKIVIYSKQRRFWESFVPVVTYEADRLAELSRPYGTKIAIEGDTGHVAL